jgi:hypothetical protein
VASLRIDGSDSKASLISSQYHCGIALATVWAALEGFVPHPTEDGTDWPADDWQRVEDGRHRAPRFLSILSVVNFTSETFFFYIIKFGLISGRSVYILANLVANLSRNAPVSVWADQTAHPSVGADV